MIVIEIATLVNPDPLKSQACATTKCWNNNTLWQQAKYNKQLKDWIASKTNTCSSKYEGMQKTVVKV
jgi:hypothetical protein